MSDELKRDYQEKLGDKFGAIVNGVSYDWANGLVRLNEYRALFGDPAVLALFTVGDVYASLCKKSVYAPFIAQRRSRALFWL